MKYYSQNSDEVLKELKTETNGLSATEAEKRLESYGPNKLAEPKKTSLFVRFLKQLSDPMTIVLLAAAFVSGITSWYSGESFADVFIILFVVVLNSVLGVVQESKAEEAIDALKTMTAAHSKVFRDGKLVSIKSEDLVVGDIILLEAGDSVPADARILECASMKVEESALTGESVPVLKHSDPVGDVALGDRKCMVYMGSTVVYGRGKAVVVACTTLENAVDIDICIGNIAVHDNRVGLIKTRLDIVLLVCIQLQINLIRVAKLWMVEVETGNRQRSHLEYQTGVILGCLALYQLVVCVNLNIDGVNLLASHSVDLDLDTGTRSA